MHGDEQAHARIRRTQASDTCWIYKGRERETARPNLFSWCFLDVFRCHMQQFKRVHQSLLSPGKGQRCQCQCRCQCRESLCGGRAGVLLLGRVSHRGGGPTSQCVLLQTTSKRATLTKFTGRPCSSSGVCPLKHISHLVSVHASFIRYPQCLATHMAGPVTIIM